MLKRIIITLLLITLPFALFGCGDEPPSAPQDNATSKEYLATIATLESELLAQKESFYIKESAYLTQIDELHQQIATLMGQMGENEQAEEVFRYRVENGEAILTGYSGGATLLTIPRELDGYPVTVIGERMLEGSRVAAVVVPDGVREIAWFAFYDCEELINITLPASVTEIGYAVFDGCERLSIYCPAGSYAEKYARSYGIECVAN